MKPHIISPGTQFVRLCVITRAPNTNGGRARWMCACDCGTELIVVGKDLLSGNTKSCGCLRADRASERLYEHGLSGTVISNAWKRMVQRCYNPKDKRFYRYGARGIQMCEHMRSSPEHLRELLGARPSSTHSVGRPNNDGMYSCGCCPECARKGWPLNIRWETAQQQARNKSTTHFVMVGEANKSLAEWAELSGIKYGTLQSRIKRGLDLFTPVKKA